MNDITMAEMLEMQRRLQEKYSHKWAEMAPENGAHSLLWGVGEIGEVIDIIKKQGPSAIMNDPGVRSDFVTELADVYMYLADMMLCFGISAEEFSSCYRTKSEKNLNRW